jgi:hypothetical protein
MTIDAQINCVRRELAIREKVYPALVADGKKHQSQAAHEIDAMRAVLETLEALKERNVP